jgi:hypothetical protein
LGTVYDEGRFGRNSSRSERTRLLVSSIKAFEAAPIRSNSARNAATAIGSGGEAEFSISNNFALTASISVAKITMQPLIVPDDVPLWAQILIVGIVVVSLYFFIRAYRRNGRL